MDANSSANFFRILRDNFPHQPTLKQEVALQQLSDFVLDTKKDRIYLLKGYAGTGKTTITGVLVSQLWHTKLKAVLMAPTGRAAKVMSTYSNTQAHTIHRKIYFPRKDKSGASDLFWHPINIETPYSSWMKPP